MSIDGGTTARSTSQLEGTDYCGKSTRESSHSSSSHHQSTRSRKGVAPCSMTDNKHKGRLSAQSLASMRRRGSESSSRLNGRAPSSSYSRDHHIWTEKEVKEFYTILVRWGSLQFKKISSVLQPDEEGSSTRFKNKWNGEKKRAIIRRPTYDCRTLIISVINDYIALLFDSSPGPVVGQEERERLASWITDLIATLPLDTNKNTSPQVTKHVVEVYNKFFNYRTKLDMLRCLYADNGLTQPLEHVTLGSAQSSPPVVGANPMQLSAPLAVSLSPQLQVQPAMPALDRCGVAPENPQYQHQQQILANASSCFNVSLQNSAQQTLANHVSSVLVQPIWSLNTTEGVAIQNPCFIQSANGLILAQDLTTLPNSDLIAQLRNMLGMPQYSNIAQMPFNVHQPEGREAIIKAIIEQNERINAQLRQQLVYQPVYQHLPQFISISAPVLPTVTYRDVESPPQVTICLANAQRAADLETVNAVDAVAVTLPQQGQIFCESVPAYPASTSSINNVSSETISPRLVDPRLASSAGLETRMRSPDMLAVSSASPAPSIDGSFSSKDTPVEISDSSGKIRPTISASLESTGPSLP
ncbi:Hypothetical protein DHA2_152111 [Giardia duodenalis]|uniref:Uncharacterized protein n=1 Tax=Giardia intestinalis TaxID=5741 RepID=V6TAU3_GIAIN|nr:Hypothetical protein DHA2_152111 [Giardia intestinalis]